MNSQNDEQAVDEITDVVKDWFEQESEMRLVGADAFIIDRVEEATVDKTNIKDLLGYASLSGIEPEQIIGAVEYLAAAGQRKVDKEGNIKPYNWVEKIVRIPTQMKREWDMYFGPPFG